VTLGHGFAGEEIVSMLGQEGAPSDGGSRMALKAPAGAYAIRKRRPIRAAGRRIMVSPPVRVKRGLLSPQPRIAAPRPEPGDRKSPEDQAEALARALVSSKTRLRTRISSIR
jgi:hypothetical protein